MTALANDQRVELLHLWAVTRDGSWTYRVPKARSEQLVTRGYAVRGEIRDTYRITPAGIACLEGGAPSTVRAWCDGCGAVATWRCVYDHVRGEVWECTACVEREGVR